MWKHGNDQNDAGSRIGNGRPTVPKRGDGFGVAAAGLGAGGV